MATKGHLACEQGQKPLSIVITAEQRGDSPQFVPVLASIRGPRIDGGRHRAVATRFDKLAVRYQATIYIAVINEWL